MVASFLDEWCEGRPWFSCVVGDKKKANCKVCLKTFSILEGQTAIKKHSEGNKHVDFDKMSKNNNNPPPPNIIAAFKQGDN